MELSLLLVEQIAALFIMGIVGYEIVKIGLLKASDSHVLSKLTVYVFAPCVNISSFQIAYTKSKLEGLLLAGAAAVMVHIIFIAVTKLLEKLIGLNSIEKASLVYSNAGNLVIPLVYSVLGKEWVFYTSAFIIVQTILIWTHGKAVICKGEENSIKKVLLNPNIIAIAAGIFLFLAKVRLPGFLGSTMDGLANMIGPASMLVIGMLIGEIDLKWVFRQKRPYLICFIRLIVLPMIVIGVFQVFGLGDMHKDAQKILMIVLLAACAPAAAMVTQLAQVYGRDAKYASIINVMSVIFCIVTMPLIVLFYMKL